MTIARHIEDVRERLRRGEFSSEAAVSQGIVLPTLQELGWPVFDIKIVVPEYSVGGRRVDYALCRTAEKPAVFVEVKRVGFSVGADRQLFEYAFHLGVPLAILTDGQEWSFYLPGEQGRYDERRVYKLDLLERDTEEAVKRLKRYLNYERVCSGEALEAARTDYRNIARDREIEAALPRAWSALLQEPDSLLLELLAEKAEDLCGYKPDLDVCSRFLAHDSQKPPAMTAPPPNITPPQSTPSKPEVGKTEFYFAFNGEINQEKNGFRLMLKVFQFIAKRDTEFLERFAARKHGTKRRYIAKNKLELYPDRPDLAEKLSIEIIPGWWLGTNYSSKNIQKILDLALEVALPEIRSALTINIPN